tara:strand:- start:1241 stop:1462 length:222 start_codon:yes stop_codon:yes gene_type:complete
LGEEMVPPRKKRVDMTNPRNFRAVDSYELEGDAREAYAEWLKDMDFAVEIVGAVNSDESVKVDIEDMELLDFE